MTLDKFKEWARTKAHEMGWSLDIVTTERDGVVNSCEAWFCLDTPQRPDTGQGWWHSDKEWEIF